MSARLWLGPVLALLAAPAAAHADAPWSPPLVVGARAAAIDGIGAATGPDGTTTLAWRAIGAQNAETTATATITRDGSRSATHVAPGRPVAGPVYRSARAIVLRAFVSSVDEVTNAVHERLGWSDVAADGTPGRWHRLTAGTLPRPASLAAGPSGALVAWSELRRGRMLVRATWAGPSGDFDTPVTLVDRPAPAYLDNGDVSAAIDADGRGAVAYDDVDVRRRNRVLAWTGTRRHGFGRAIDVGPHAGSAAIASAVDVRGRAFVAWETQGHDDQGVQPPQTRIAVLARGAARVRLLDRGSDRIAVPTSPVVAVRPGGGVSVAWNGGAYNDAFEGHFEGYPLREADVAPDGSAGTVTTLWFSGLLGGIAVRDDGTTLVTWSRAASGTPSAGGTPSASLRPASAAAFGAPETLDDEHTLAPVAAFDGRGRPFAAWAGADAGGAVVRSETRNGP